MENEKPTSMFERKMRPVHTFTIPESLRSTGGPTTVTLVELMATQELDASSLGRYNLLKSQYEAVNLSIYALDGKPVDRTGIELDQFWENTNPRVRSLLLQAYNKISSPSDEEHTSFFDSEKVEVAKV